MLSFQAANILVGNDRFTEALEVTMMGPKLRFYTDAVIAVTGAEIAVTLDSVTVPQWTTLNVSKGQVLNTGTAVSELLQSITFLMSSRAVDFGRTSPSKGESPILRISLEANQLSKQRAWVDIKVALFSLETCWKSRRAEPPKSRQSPPTHN